jgi:arginyl-tRNA synthetase
VDSPHGTGSGCPSSCARGDGGYGYGATDLAAIRHRILDLKATRLVYVVGSPQHQHLEMVFQLAREAGWLGGDVEATHVGFGQVLGSDGKRFASRADGAVKLADLLTEAVARAKAIVMEKNPSLSPAEQETVAHAVGMSAIKYADLSHHRLTTYLQALAGTYTAFYERCPVLQASPGVRASRLVLCDVTARIIAQGLGLLGITAPERM